MLDGRTRDIVKKGGYLVALREVEILAQQHDIVREAAAVTVPHDFYGETFVLYVVPEPGGDESHQNDLSRFLHANLMKYKWPEKIVYVEDFPRTASGKVRKHLLHT